MSRTFFIADTHFDHGNILKYENRPFKDVEDMNNSLIRNWNNKVKKKDRVYHLGDFAFSNKPKIMQLLEKLNGYKCLVMGNHDRRYTYSWWLKSGFDEVIRYPTIIEDFFILSHEPMYMNEHMPYVNIHGHVHSDPLYVDYSANSYCVSVERISHEPIELKEIKKRIGGLPGNENA